jgi:ferredoxin/flavodoxin
MLKIAIFCFSGTGNTYFVANAICEVIRQTDHCDVFALEKHIEDANELIADYDIIGLGYPIYGSSLPPIVFRFIEKLSVHQKEAFTFCTQLLFSGDGAAYGGRQLEKKGFVVRWQEHFLMPNNITDLRFFDRKKPYDYAKIEHSVKKKASRLVSWIRLGKEHRKGSHFGSLLLGLLQRVPFEAMNPKSLTQAVRIDSGRCVQCGVCVSLCPVKNLQIIEETIVPQNNCTLCYRCVNHCHTNAIRIAAKSYVKYPYHGPSHDFVMASVQTDNLQGIDKG